MLEDRTLEQQQKLPTQRSVVIVGLHQLSSVIDGLTIASLMKPKLRAVIDPLRKQAENAKMNLSQDLDNLETSVLIEMHSVNYYTTQVDELRQEVALRTEKFGEEVVARNKAEISCEDKDDEIARLKVRLEQSQELARQHLQLLEANRVDSEEAYRKLNRARDYFEKKGLKWDKVVK